MASSDGDAELVQNLKVLLKDELFASAEILGSLLLQRPAATSSADGGQILALRAASVSLSIVQLFFTFPDMT